MMDEPEWLTERFQQHRSHLRAVAYRMLGSVSEADDALRTFSVRGQDPGSVENMQAWLTTVVGRVCLVLRSTGATGLSVHVGSVVTLMGCGPSTSAARRVGRAGAARGVRCPDSPPSGSRSSCTTCSACRLRHRQCP
jgi:hypothetical protein